MLRVGELIKARQLLQFELDLMQAAADPSGGQTERILRAALPHPGQDWIAAYDESGGLISMRGNGPNGNAGIVVPLSNGRIEASRLGPPGVDEERLCRAIRRAVSAWDVVTCRSDGRSLAETKLTMQSDLRIDDLSATLPTYLERLCSQIGAERASLHFRRDERTTRCIAAGGSESPVLRELEALALAGEQSAAAIVLPISASEGSPVVLVATASRPLGITGEIEDLLRWSATHLTTVLKQTAGQLNLAHEARVDRLTGLANRRWFDHRLDEAIADSQETLRPVSLVLIDIDHFKRVNDTLGHLAGDAAIRDVAALLESVRARQRSSDDCVLARYGGEELAILLPGLPASVAMRLAEQVRSEVEAARFSQDQTDFRLTISAGYGEVAGPAATGERLIAIADEHLYAAKQGGRNRACGPTKVHFPPPATVR